MRSAPSLRERESRPDWRYPSLLSHLIEFFLAMYGLGVKPSRPGAKVICGLWLLALPMAALPAAARADHGFNRGNWPFRPLERPEAPATSSAWAANPIDRFILIELEKRGLTPSGPADKATLLRRVTFDLIGLPPTPEEVEDFRADDSPLAYERVVDRLLASPRLGERWVVLKRC